MSNQSLFRRNFVSRILRISAVIAGLVATGCGTSSSGGNGGGGTNGGSPSLAAAVAATGMFSSGEQGATYTITVSNTGTAATNGTVTVADPPTGFTATAISGANWTCTLATTTCTYSLSVGAGQSFPAITVIGNVTSAKGTLVTIPLTLSGGGASSVTVAPAPTVTVVAAMLGITKSHMGSFTQGQEGGTYTVTVSNPAGQPATSGTVTVTEMPPSGLTVTGMAGGSGSSWACVAMLSCTRSDALAGGKSYDPITVTVSVKANATSPQVNAVEVSGGGSSSNSTTDSTTITETSCPLSLLGNEDLLSGTHIAILSGWKDGGGPSQAVAAFTADGAGGVTSGEMDSGTVVVSGASQSAPALTTISSGCYQLGPDNRGLTIWNFTGGGSVTFAISISPNDQGGSGNYLIEFDDANPGTSPGTRLAGRMYFQIPGPYTLASFSGPFSFFTAGYSPNSGNTDYLRSGTVARLDDSATGGVTNGALNVGLTSAPGTRENFDNQSFTGTFGPPDALGRGILTLNFPSFGTLGAITFNFAYYISDVNDLYLQSIDTPDDAGHPLQSGDVVTQVLTSYTVADLSGNAILFMDGADLSASHSFTVTDVGRITGDGLGGASAMLDEVSNGSAVCTGTNTISGGSFAVSPNGMGVLTIGPSACAKSISIAMFDQNSGYILEGTAASPGSNVLSGALRPQTGAGGFGDGVFSGEYVFGIHRQASTNSVFEVGSVTAPTPPTNPASFTGEADESSAAGCTTGCLSADQAISATYSIDTNGRITILGLTGGTSVGWFVHNGKSFWAISDTTDANGTILNVNK